MKPQKAEDSFVKSSRWWATFWGRRGLLLSCLRIKNVPWNLTTVIMTKKWLSTRLFSSHWRGAEFWRLWILWVFCPCFFSYRRLCFGDMTVGWCSSCLSKTHEGGLHWVLDCMQALLWAIHPQVQKAVLEERLNGGSIVLHDLIEDNALEKESFQRGHAYGVNREANSK